MTFHSPVILIAEHEDAEWAEISRILTELTITPVRARNGAAAVGVVSRAWRENRTPALMLIDLDLPMLDALGVTRCIRTLGVSEQDMPIIALGRDGDDAEVAACVEAGMQWHLSRPLRAKALVSLIDRWTGAGAIVQDEPAQDLRRDIDPAVLPLVPAFVRRCEACRECAETLLAAMPELPDAGIERLCTLMHQLAGSSALFDAVRLGDAARDVERALRAMTDDIDPTDPAQLRALIAEFLAILDEVRRDSGFWTSPAA